MLTLELRTAIGNMTRTTGRRYPALEKALEEVPAAAQHDFLRMTRDFDDSIRAAERKGAREPWRHMR